MPSGPPFVKDAGGGHMIVSLPFGHSATSMLFQFPGFGFMPPKS
jgi:hypothetical protein